ncbi:MAG: tyrosine--tRNA ligase [Candidatus Doudnabacteria bacterium]|nr:tyrosine--tRNA ligase [Candidatus Doudnabacteria bacterium]
MNKQQQIDELLSRGVTEVINKEELRSLLLGKKKLRVKLGIDPTSPNIHIGRAVVLWKLRAFQELGHKIVFIVGDFTGLIGDTSDKDSERPMLTEAQVKSNLKSYLTQAFKILDKTKTETHFNSKWLKKLGLAEIGSMANLFGLHEFEARENISKRMKAGKRVSLRELLYPLMQGYDSVAVKADVELGGTDQRFNLLAGRTIQPAYGQTPQQILTTELLEGTDGRKMSSSWGNVVNLLDEPKDMFGKIMSISDELIEKYFTLATRVSLKEIEAVITKNQNPRDQKLVLAERITALYHGDKKASEARTHFISQFSKKELPSDIPTVKITPGNYQLTELLLMAKLVASKSEARRLIEQKGVRINGEVAPSQSVTIGKQNNLLLQVGKRKFVTIK